MRWSRATEHGAEGRASCLTPARPAFRVHPTLWTYPIMPASSRPSDPVRVARWGLFVLTLVNLFNYLDRFVLSPVVESQKRSALHLSDTQLGALATDFILVYMLTSPIYGTLCDRGNRPP